METRNGKIIVSAAGGTAGRGSKTYKLSLPSSWLAEMGITAEETGVQLSFDGNSITVRKPLSFREFAEKKKALGHDLKMISYFDGDALCTRICADFTDRTLAVENDSDCNLSRAFGVNETPSWEDFLAFLEERSMPRQRDGLRYYLDELGLDAYDPWQIVQRTSGRMAEDRQWLRVEDVE